MKSNRGGKEFSARKRLSEVACRFQIVNAIWADRVGRQVSHEFATSDSRDIGSSASANQLREFCFGLSDSELEELRFQTARVFLKEIDQSLE